MNTSESQSLNDGKKGENLFRELLQESNMPFLYIEQSDYDNFSVAFKNNIKRPDFLLLVQQMGLLAVDVKYLSPWEDGQFTLEFDKELKRSMDFEHSFKIYLWYAIRNKADDSDKNWYFISAFDALENGELKERKDGAGSFMVIDRRHFRQLTDLSKIGDLFNDRIGFSGMMGRFIESYFRKSTSPKT